PDVHQYRVHHLRLQPDHRPVRADEQARQHDVRRHRPEPLHHGGLRDGPVRPDPPSDPPPGGQQRPNRRSRLQPDHRPQPTPPATRRAPTTLFSSTAACRAIPPFPTRRSPAPPTSTNTDCTASACNQATGQCVPTTKPDSTACGDTDGNLCTTAGCEMGQCVQTHIQTPCPPDTNDCTDDLCNPATGLCQHPPKPDSTTCGDTDG